MRHMPLEFGLIQLLRAFIGSFFFDLQEGKMDCSYTVFLITELYSENWLSNLNTEYRYNFCATRQSIYIFIH